MNLASRLVKVAEPGTVAASSEIATALEDHLQFTAAAVGERTLKGFDDPVPVYRIEVHR